MCSSAGLLHPDLHAFVGVYRDAVSWPASLRRSAYARIQGKTSCFLTSREAECSAGRARGVADTPQQSERTKPISGLAVHQQALTLQTVQTRGTETKQVQ